uniref:Uncharacterized protein n=1 Tax=Tetranychus urticae TaxID=32264 RepID=T1KF40_TETUR
MFIMKESLEDAKETDMINSKIET